MTGNVLDLKGLSKQEELAKSITLNYTNWRTQRQPWERECKEVRDYIFATDTSSTSNAELPWKNSTTVPKLTQIRDLLHSNYIATLFPNDQWLQWEAYDDSAENKEKRELIEAYIATKCRQSGFEETMSDALLDWIDTGVCITDVEWVHEYTIHPVTEEKVTSYVGPRAKRVRPNSIVFNPTASDWNHTPKITRILKTVGELMFDAHNNPSLKYSQDALDHAMHVRKQVTGLDLNDKDINAAYNVDGFGSLSEYYGSGMIEILEAEGNFYDAETGEFLQDHIITIIDRSVVLRKEANPSWLGSGYKQMSSWRKRPDNLYGMGPLANLVGMQYRIDHLENLKADLMDLTAFPPVIIQGEVDEFKWQPLEQIRMDEGANVSMLQVDTNALNADMQIATIERRMEELVGAPKEAMGIRSQGEKTMFEVASLQNASSRMFQTRLRQFEKEVIEPTLNGMLEMSKRMMTTEELALVLDDEVGAERFVTITKKDLQQKGKLRPIGSRHFAMQAQLVQNLTQLSNTRIWEETKQHRSSKKLAVMIEDLLGIKRFGLYSDNIAIFEAQDTQRLAGTAEEELAIENELPSEDLM